MSQTYGEQPLKGLNVVINGASRRIGRATALMFAENGCDLCLVDRNEDELRKIADECRKQGARNAHIIAADLIDENQLEQVVQRITKNFNNRVNILVNNNGEGNPGHSLDSRWRDWNSTLTQNLNAVMHLTHSLVQVMRETGRDSNQTARIINIGSMASKTVLAGAPDYIAAKHGVRGFANALFEDVRDQGIKVCTVNPGYIDMDSSDVQGRDRNKSIRPEDVAYTVLFCSKFPRNACPVEVDILPQYSA